jgi:GNAT superfamily N-acetyltransferase
MKITIKKLSAEDLPLVTPLFNDYRMFYGQPADLPGATDFLSERTARGESVIFLALTSEGQALGFTQLYPIFSSVSMRRTWLLNDLFVNANARKMGVGQALLTAAKNWAQETNAKWLLLQTGADNFSAQALYEKDGWVRENDLFYRFDIE